MSERVLREKAHTATRMLVVSYLLVSFGTIVAISMKDFSFLPADTTVIIVSLIDYVSLPLLCLSLLWWVYRDTMLNRHLNVAYLGTDWRTSTGAVGFVVGLGKKAETLQLAFPTTKKTEIYRTADLTREATLT